MRYEVERQDANGEWKPMASHDDLALAKSLLTDKHRRIRDTELGGFIVYSPPAAADSSMGRRRYLRVLAVMAWRTLQGTVVIPAALVGAFMLLVTIATGENPVRVTLEVVYRFAETSVRPASPGHVFLTECVSKPTSDILTPKAVVCDSANPKEVSIDDAIASTMDSLRNLYAVLMLISFGALVMVFPGRRFLGLPDDPPANV